MLDFLLVGIWVPPSLLSTFVGNLLSFSLSLLYLDNLRCFQKTKLVSSSHTRSSKKVTSLSLKTRKEITEILCNMSIDSRTRIVWRVMETWLLLETCVLVTCVIFHAP
ncbi:hypothetical protein YC2023_014237 [Brassica napus]